ncbi:MAG: potassium channel protein [Bacteroidetes bacterium]|nr:potassium channel protein [Bacteroidota bacterium]
MNIDAAKQFKLGLLLLFLVIIVGTVGYEILEVNWTLLDSFYMTIITISTTGFREVKDLSQPGRMFTVFLIISGVLTIAYTGGKAAQILIETQVLRRRKMSKELEKISDHYIVCGYGRMGRQICEGLVENQVPFVVIENDQKKLTIIKELNLLFIEGDATNDEILIKAGIKRAKGLVAVIRTDAENVFATLSARELSPEIFVVARAVEDGTEKKLITAGANRVVKPYELGGNRMVQLLLRPGVIDFIDGVARNKNVEISLEEITLNEGSILVGKSLSNSPVRKDLNIIIVAISRNDGNFIYNPKSDTKFEVNDKLIAIGEQTNLSKLTELCLKN